MNESNSRTQPEIFGTEAASRDTLSRRAKRGDIRRIAPGLYTSNLTDPLEDVVRRNLWLAVANVAPDAVVTDRTGLEGRPADDGSVFIVSRRARIAELPGVTVRPRSGPSAVTDAVGIPHDMHLPGGIFMASRARALLENCRPTRRGVRRTLTSIELETFLERMLRTSGGDAVNRLRDEARVLAGTLDLTAEFERLDRIIGALQGTRSGKLLTQQGRARAAGNAFDSDRLELFSRLHEHLRSLAPIVRMAPPHDAPQLRHLPFFEAYFSNFIEGTEFQINEAARIVYENAVPHDRPADAHDISGTYAIVNDRDFLTKTPRNSDEFLDLLRARHAALMELRPEKRPGQFKELANRAGATDFTHPSLVEGTLRQGFELYRSLETAFERATYLMFLVTEVHPFDDGNGRIARIMMNAELVAANEWRIIIPTVYRNNYLQALRALTHNANPTALPRMLDFAQRFTASLDYAEIKTATQLLENTNALHDANEAEQTGARLQMPTPELFARVVGERG